MGQESRETCGWQEKQVPESQHVASLTTVVLCVRTGVCGPVTQPGAASGKELEKLGGVSHLPPRHLVERLRGGLLLVMVGCLQGQIRKNFLRAVLKPG